MILGDDGKYYLGEGKQVEITSNLIYQIYSEISQSFFSENSINFSMDIEGKNYNFLYENNTLFYVGNKSKYQIKIQSVKIIFRVKNQDHIRYIFTYEQFEKNLTFFKISFPWSEDTIVTKNKIIESIKKNDKRFSIIIENIDFKSLKNPNVTKLNKFNDLSKYISYYLKGEINIEKYEEKEFLDQNLFAIDPQDEIEFFIPIERRLFLDDILFEFKDGKKEYFFTGLHSIGKTFTLLAFNFIKQSAIKTAYFNLETLKKRKKFFEIIIYESQNLFDSKEEWENAFLSLKNKINDTKNFLRILFNLIKLLAEKYIKKDINYIIILDQIKFENVEDNEYKEINSIRDFVKNTNNLYLIGCCSINYKGVKEILFYNWTRTNEEPNEKKIPILNYINSWKFNNENTINNSNKYLNLLGNIPRFKNIETKLNSKIVNLFLKKTKEKFLKFYGLKNFLEFEKIENIPVLKSFDQKADFLQELDKIPFKYFEIYEDKNMFDFSCPLIKRAIEELLEENELNKQITDNNCELGWYFAKRVIYSIRTKNLIPEKCYIDNSYLIPTIFLPHKVEGLDLKENSLFYFEYCNVRRYDSAIYLGTKQALILIQISIKKPEKKLDEYNLNNFQKDLEDIQRFLKINKLKIKNYYLVFILEHSYYKKKENIAKIDERGFSYILYDLEDNKFQGKLSDNLFEITNTINSNLDINIIANSFEFGIIDGSFNYKYLGRFHKYYVEKNWSLERFFNEIFDEAEKYEFKKISELEFSKFYLWNFDTTYLQALNPLIPRSDKILLLNYQDYNIYYGSGISQSDFTWHCFDMMKREKKYVKKKNYYLTMECFLFLYRKNAYPKK